MKRVYLAILMLAVCIGLCGIEQYTVERTYQDATALLDTAITYTQAEDYTAAAEVCKTLDRYWDKKHPYLTAMIDHGTLDEASATIYGLEALAAQDSENLYDSLLSVKTQLQTVRENQKITFGNIF